MRLQDIYVLEEYMSGSLREKVLLKIWQ